MKHIAIRGSDYYYIKASKRRISSRFHVTSDIESPNAGFVFILKKYHEEIFY